MRQRRRSIVAMVVLATAWIPIGACTSPRSPGGASTAAPAPTMRLAVMAYTFREFTMLEAIEKTRALGVRYMEGFSWQRVGDEFGDARFDFGAPPEARAAVKRALTDAGIQLVNHYSHVVGTDADATRKTFDFCREMGVETIVAEPEPALFDDVESLAREYGIRVAIHNHANPSRYWSPDVVLAAIEHRGPMIGVCADTGWWVRSGVDPVAALRRLQGRVFCLHLKDLNTAGVLDAVDVPWGTGVVDVRGILAELKRQRFGGVISIEYESNPKDNVAEVTQCMSYFARVTSKPPG